MGDERDRQEEGRDPAVLLASLPSEFTARYRVGDLLGRGGQGVAVMAKQLRLNRDVVVKFLLASDELEMRRFLREAELLSRMRHPNVVRLFDFGQLPTGPYLVLELLTGSTLGARIAARDLDLEAITGVAADILSGLDAVHSLGVVHRDIKPANIFLDREGRAKLLDFGIARHDESSRLTREGHFVGTPAYSSPELLAGEPMDGRSDLYSAGVVLIEMLTGINPFHDAQLSVTVERHFSQDVTRITGSRFPVGRGLENLVVSLLQKSPANRPDSAIAALELLERAAPGSTQRATRAVRLAPGELSGTSFQMLAKSPPVPATAGETSSSTAVARPVPPGPRSAGLSRSGARPGSMGSSPAPVPPVARFVEGSGRRLLAVAAVLGMILIAVTVRTRLVPDPVAPGLTESPSASGSALSSRPSGVGAALGGSPLASLEEIRAFMKERREVYLADLAEREKQGLDLFAIEADDFRVPSITPLLEAMRAAPEGIRLARAAPAGIQDWVNLEVEIYQTLNRLDRLGNQVIKEEQKYVGKTVILSRAASRGQECVTVVTPILNEAPPAPAGATDPYEIAYDVFQQLLTAHVDQELYFLAPYVRGQKGIDHPQWIRAYYAPELSESGERVLRVHRRLRDLPAAWITTRPMLEYRVRMLQEVGRWVAWGEDEVGNLFADEVNDQLRRRLDLELHVECLGLARSWLDAAPRIDIDDRHALGLLWRVLIPVRPPGSPETKEAWALASRILERVEEFPRHLDPGTRARNDPGPRDVLVPFSAGLDGHGKKIVDALIEKLESAPPR